MAINLSRIGNKKHRIEARTITTKSFNFVALWRNTSDFGYVTFRGPGWSHADLHALSQNEFYGVAIFLFSFLF